MKIFEQLFGQFNSLRQKASAQPRKFFGTLIVIALLLAALFAAWQWYLSLPQGERITAKINAPKLTPIEKVLVPEPLGMDFGVYNNDELDARSVAPLDLVGKEVSKGISMNPAMPGKWMWDADSHLLFTPEKDWPANQKYTIRFARDFFTSEVKMASYEYTFSTMPFTADIKEFKFYQNPVKPDDRYVVATMQFAFPVDAISLKNNIDLRWEKGAAIPFDLTYDNHKRIAYLHSGIISLPQKEQYIDLILAKNTESQSHTAKLAEKKSATLLIPDANSYLKISASNAVIVRNQQDRPEQILNIETTLGVTEAELGKSIHAYLLPKDYPATSAETAKINYEWQNPGEISDAILAASTPVTLQAIPADHDFSSLHSYRFHALTPGYLYVKIDKGLHGFGNFSLSSDFATIINVPAYPQEIAFLHKGALLPLGTEEKLSVLVRGLGTVKFDIARVRAEDINHLVTQTIGDFNNPFFINASFNQENISEISSFLQSFDATDPGKEQYTALDLGKFLTKNTGSNLGLFLLRAQGYDPVKKMTLEITANRLILITDLGLIVKDNADGTHDVFVQSITNGTPVANASVSVLGKNGVALLTRPTDANGRITIPSLKDFANDHQPAVYVVTNANDVSFIPYNRSNRQLNYSRFDIGGITTPIENTAALSAYIFSDRGIYRPGDTAHIGMIVKQPYAMPAPAGIPLEASIIDPRGTSVKTWKLTLDASGYMTLDFPTNTVSPTGQYQIYLNIVKDGHVSSLIGSTAIRVAEFLPDRMKLSAHFSQTSTKGWLSPDDLSIDAGLWNLYGAPAVNHRVTGKIILTPRVVTFSEYPDYIFIDPLLNPKSPAKTFTDTLSEVKTNDQGQAILPLKLEKFDKATYQLSAFVEGFEAEGGRSVTTHIGTLISPLTYFVGYKTSGDLRYIKQAASLNVNLIAINPQLQQQALNDLTLKVFSQRPVSTLVKKEDGTYQYQSIVQTSEISSQAFAIAAAGTDYLLPANTIGDFLVTINSKDGMELSHFKYSIVGASQQPLPQNAELNMKLNQSVFKAGDEIEMQITAPYTGTGLITIERDKVYNAQWFKTSTTASLQKIRIPADFQGDGYVNIAFVRDINSPEIFVSPLSYNVQPFSVTHEAQAIKVDLDTPALARPGDNFNITYKTDKPGKIIVFAVDEGILQVAKFATPDPLAFFFQKHALEVNTMQILDQILPKFIADRELSSVGGDEGERALRNNLNPFKRKTEAPVVYWSGIMDTDTNAHTLAYKIPDYFNGSLRVMAVAVSANAVGAAAKEAQIRGYFVIQPNVPLFVAPGDEFEVTAGIANNVEGSGKNASINVHIEATPELELVDKADQTIPITEGQEQSVKVKVRAKSQLGAAAIKFITSLNNKSSAYTATLSVRPAVPYATQVMSGYTLDSKKSLSLTRILFPEYRKVDVALSTSPVILMTGIQQYLNDYPYGCVEQLVSKAFAWLALANQPWLQANRDALNDNIQKTILMLNQRQMSNGGFSYWPGFSSGGNDFASVYAVHFLTEARAQGYSVQPNVFSAAIGFLKDVASRTPATLNDARITAYAIYVLTRNEIITSNYLTHLQLTLDAMPSVNWKQDIISAYMAATYQMLKSEAQAEKMIAYYNPDVAREMPTDFYNQDTENAQYLYLIAKHFPQRFAAISQKLLPSLVNALNDNTMSTILSGYTTLALSASQVVDNAAEYSISEILANGEEKLLTNNPGNYKFAAIDMNASKINLNNPAKQMLFYQFTQAGFDQPLPQRVVNQGIEVVREYRNADDKSLADIKAGDEIMVHLRARSTDNQYHDNVAIVDLLPGGFEVVRNALSINNVDYVDAREDRVIFFGGVSADSREIIYRIKATSAGKFIVPPSYATSMYNPMVKSMGKAGSVEVK